ARYAATQKKGGGPDPSRPDRRPNCSLALLRGRRLRRLLFRLRRLGLLHLLLRLLGGRLLVGLRRIALRLGDGRGRRRLGDVLGGERGRGREQRRERESSQNITHRSPPGFLSW